MEQEAAYRRQASAASVILGVGIGGFLDGIILHQILQWHHMLSSVLPPTEMENMMINMRWDGFFHLFVLLAIIVGIFMLWSVARRRVSLPGTRWFAGLMLMGWGLFNLVEGIINHHLLGIHHVRYVGDVPGGEPHLAWSLGFILVGGVLFLAAGWLLARSDPHRQVA